MMLGSRLGDAAQAYDPLSSQGIDKALRTASHAGHMIHYAVDGPPAVRRGIGQRQHVHPSIR